MQINIPAANRLRLVEVLNQSLAELTDLQLAAKQAHWNLRGPLFRPLHELFDELADDLRRLTDDVAERAVQLGGQARGTLQQAALGSAMAPYPPEVTRDLDHAGEVAARVADATNRARLAIIVAIDLGDQDTGDLYIDVSRTLDKKLWMLRAHLEPSAPAPVVVTSLVAGRRTSRGPDVRLLARTVRNRLGNLEKLYQLFPEWATDLRASLRILLEHARSVGDQPATQVINPVKDLDADLAPLSRVEPGSSLLPTAIAAHKAAEGIFKYRDQVLSYLAQLDR